MKRLSLPRPTSGASDAALLEQVAAGHLGALGELYDRYARDVWRAARRALIDEADAEDVVHQTFLGLPRIAASYDGRDRCRSWLCGIAVRLAMRQRRGAGRFRKMLDAFAQTVTGAHKPPDPERRASGNEEMEALERAMGTLSDKKLAVFVLVELEGLSAEEAARALEIPPATARTRLFHARRELQESLRRQGVE